MMLQASRGAAAGPCREASARTPAPSLRSGAVAPRQARTSTTAAAAVSVGAAASPASAPLCVRRRRATPTSSLAAAATEAAASPTTDAGALWEELRESCAAYAKAAPSEKLAYSSDVLDALKALKAAGEAPAWGSVFGADADEGNKGLFERRSVLPGVLRQAGIKNPDAIARPSVRNDAAFLATVVGVTSVMAVVGGATLPGQWGFWATYGSGGIAIVVLAIGSTAPGLLEFFIDKFSQLWPDYKQRVIDHEAAHVLIGHLAGVPVVGYSLAIGQEHSAFAEAKMGKRLIEGRLAKADVDALAPVAVAGVAAEGQRYEEVMGQTADLFDLQRILLRSEEKLSDAQQQSVTRWAVWCAATALRQHARAYDAAREAMANGLPVDAVIRAIEKAEADDAAEAVRR